VASPGSAQLTACFLAERYQPRGTTSDALAARVAAEREAANGRLIGLLQAIYLPDDETCFTLFDAATPDAVQQASDSLHWEYSRVLSAISVITEVR
jgi:hypothetical protein